MRNPDRRTQQEIARRQRFDDMFNPKKYLEELEKQKKLEEEQKKAEEDMRKNIDAIKKKLDGVGL